MLWAETSSPYVGLDPISIWKKKICSVTSISKAKNWTKLFHKAALVKEENAKKLLLLLLYG
ncbi:hypothetical protein ES288_D11G149700v1 [Gossypium darwinii]|uniref:Uncharacterized protein n=1 Tax=Gossypium darwinii TaxID=34276 RepID=A0A5D2AL38_GOSDA|nr:hypothetical protein ES288_D11G149700v1 [Gossypium darwinii]